MKRILRIAITTIGGGALLVACDHNQPSENRSGNVVVPPSPPRAPGPTSRADDDDDGDGKKLERELSVADGAQIEGKVVLEETTEGVRVTIDVSDAPAGPLGTHIHERADCSDIAGESMGGHFAPGGHPHGLPSEPGPKHLGDMGNITIDADGDGRHEHLVRGATLRPGDEKSLLGRAVVIHSAADKGTQPTGDAGKPMACAAIEAG